MFLCSDLLQGQGLHIFPFLLAVKAISVPGFPQGSFAGLPLCLWSKAMVEPGQHTKKNTFKPPFHPLKPRETPAQQHMVLSAGRMQLGSRITCGAPNEGQLYSSNQFSDKPLPSNYINSGDCTQIFGWGLFSVLNSAVTVNTTLQCAGSLFAATGLKCGFLFPHLLCFPQSIAFAGAITFLGVCKINLV